MHQTPVTVVNMEALQANFRALEDAIGSKGTKVQGTGLNMSGSAHATGTGNMAVQLIHDDSDGYPPWSAVDGDYGLIPPYIGGFDLKVTIAVAFSVISDELGSPNFDFIVPWGGDKAFANFYSPRYSIFDTSSVGPEGLPDPDSAVYGSFSGTVLRGPDADVLRHYLTVEMHAINENPLSSDPGGPPVADSVVWVAQANFEYFDRRVGTSL